MAQYPTGATVRNDTPEAIQVPMAGVGERSRLLLPGATTLLTREARHDSRVLALIRVRSLRVLDDGKGEPERDSGKIAQPAPDLATEDEALDVPEPAQPEEDPDMPARR